MVNFLDLCMAYLQNMNSLCSPSLPALTEGYVGALHENRHGSSAQIRRRKASGDPYWAYSGELMCSDQDHTGQSPTP
ncbi:receptor-type tyrosine-protein [Lynx pardinus]|uniref:Receptor-type tyrosine-protein n=1 Tax=Lynx pardinus TaxID=191816 RepID=A0A485P9J4_LYNPA|nr:receptor-type tyrosine-protein [Lynx pardinus]